MSDSSSTPTANRWTRRALFGLGGLVAAPRAAAAQLRQPGLPAPTVFQNLQLKMLRRMTYGPAAEDIASIYMYGFDSYLNQQLDPASIDDAACDTRLAPFTTLNMTAAQTLATDSTTVTTQIQDAALLRAIYSRRQLLERTVEFWSDHFTTNINIVGVYKSWEVRDVYRRHAFGVFRDMLNGSFLSPAMLIYLNGAQNTRTAPNQNYAREIMELHTLGVNGGYTQQDVAEVARCFTGWRYASSTTDPRAGTAFYDSTRHDNNSKLVLGVPIPSGGGQADGQTVINILVNHPSTHRFVAQKLLRWFLDYDPSTTLVAQTAEIFRQKNGDIKEVLRSILTSQNIQNARPLFKRPYHLIISSLRALGIGTTSLSTVRGTYLPSVGHGLYVWATPDGYPHEYAYWGQLPLARWNYAFSLANGSISGAPFATANLTAFLGGAVTAAQVADRIDGLLFGNEMLRADKDALITFLKPDNPTTTRVRDAIGLALSSPGFQWH